MRDQDEDAGQELYRRRSIKPRRISNTEKGRGHTEDKDLAPAEVGFSAKKFNELRLFLQRSRHSPNETCPSPENVDILQTKQDIIVDNQGAEDAGQPTPQQSQAEATEATTKRGRHCASQRKNPCERALNVRVTWQKMHTREVEVSGVRVRYMNEVGRDQVLKMDVNQRLSHSKDKPKSRTIQIFR